MKLINSKFLSNLPNYSLSEVENLIRLFSIDSEKEKNKQEKKISFSVSNSIHQDIEISTTLLEAVLELLKEVAKEKKIELSSNLFLEKEEFTTQEAADYLNISRPYLIKLLKKGEIPFYKIGTHRRVKVYDILDYENHLKEKQNTNLEELTKQAQELNLGY